MVLEMVSFGSGTYAKVLLVARAGGLNVRREWKWGVVGDSKTF